MFQVKLLTGLEAGKIFTLDHALTTLGRDPSCDIFIPSRAISKTHGQFEKNPSTGNIVFVDMGSSNGTLINGKKIQAFQLKPGDQIKIHDIVLVFEKMTDQAESANGEKKLNLYGQKLHKLIFASLYEIPSKTPFSNFIIISFIFLSLILSLLSGIPLARHSKNVIFQQSSTLAQEYAKAVSNSNRKAIVDDQLSQLNLQKFDDQKGVFLSFIIKKSDGSYLAPSRLAGEYPKNPYIHKIRKKSVRTPTSVQLSKNKILALDPISLFDSETKQEKVVAYSGIILNQNSFKNNSNYFINLIVQNILIAFLIAFLFGYIFLQIILYPYKKIDAEIESQLASESGNFTSPYKSKEMEKSFSQILSILNHKNQEASNSNQIPMEIDRTEEKTQLIQMVGFPALTIDPLLKTIDTWNDGFEDLVQISQSTRFPISELLDNPLKLTLEDLATQIVQKSDQILDTQLEMNGQNFQIAMSAIHGSQEILYLLVIFVMLEDE